MPRFTWRVHLLFALLIAAVVGLDVRLYFLMRDEHARVQELAQREERVVRPIPSRPGNISAAAGKRFVPLATSKQVPSCFVDPFLMTGDEITDTASRVGAILRQDPGLLKQRWLARHDSRFLWVARDMAPEQADAISALRHHAVKIVYEWKRVYPNDELAATVVGFRGWTQGLPDPNDWGGCIPGAGLEMTQREYLANWDGSVAALSDVRRRPIWPLPADSRLPSDGGHVLLHLDLIIQGYLQEGLAATVEKYGAKWGAAVAVDPQTGEVLAMCSAPTYNPNDYGQSTPEQRTNHALTSPYEPGSVFKPILAAAAVDRGVLTWQTKIFCENGTYLAHRGGRISDHGNHYGWMTLAEIIVQSSNIGMAKVGEMLGCANQYRAVREFGFGEPTGIPLPAESRGILRPLPRWDGYSLRRVPFGQEISTTTLQLAMAYSALVNGGELLAPRLVDRITDPSGRAMWHSERHVIRRVIKPSTSAQVREVLGRVVTEGTGKKAQLSSWTCFGKTGTAQIAGPGGYTSGAYVASFVGGAPVSDPRLLVVVSIYWPAPGKGYYGGVLAAPVVKDVLEKSLPYLDVPPDKSIQTASRTDTGRPRDKAAAAGLVTEVRRALTPAQYGTGWRMDSLSAP